jgi:hypothetical protein
MGVLSDLLSTSSILSGGITFANDKMLKATGQGKTSTLGAVNDALKHGPLESSINHGKVESFSSLWADRNRRLGQDESGNARKIGDIAAVVGMAYGGAALGGAMGGGTAAAGEGAVSGTGLSATGSGVGMTGPSTGYFGAAGGEAVSGGVGSSMGGAGGLSAPSTGALSGSGSVAGSSASTPGWSWKDAMQMKSGSQQKEREPLEQDEVKFDSDGTPYIASSKKLKTNRGAMSSELIARGASGADQIDQNGVQVAAIQALSKHINEMELRISKFKNKKVNRMSKFAKKGVSE